MTKIVKSTWIVLCLLMVMASTVRGTEVGEALPDFSFQSFDGKSLTRETFTGKPMLLVFWNTWCSDCMRELPKINQLAKEFGPRGLAVLAVNTGLNDNESKARAYWRKSGYVFPTAFDHSFKIGTSFKILGVPTVFLVDSKGIVRYKQPLPPKDMAASFKQLAGK